MSDPKQIKFSLLGATFETGNMGVGALAAASIKCILSTYPRAEISLFDYAKQSSVCTVRVDDREVSIPIVNMRFSKKIYLPNNIALLLTLAIAFKLVAFKKVREWVINKNICLSHLQQSDISAAISGGDSFSDIYGLGRLIYVALPQLLVLLLGKKLILLPQTIGPFRGKLSRIIARYILQRSERVYVRDTRSFSELKRLFACGSVPEKYKFCYDVAFALDPIAPSRQDIVGLSLRGRYGSRLIGLNISGLLFRRDSTGRNAFGLCDDYEELIEALISFLMRKKDVAVLLVPHVFGRQPGSESDTLVCEQVFAKADEKYRGRIGLIHGSYNQSEIKHIIGLCDFFIGSRMHACIAALSQGVPAVAIAYSDKFLGVMETIGIPSLVLDARALATNEILHEIDDSFEKRALIRRCLESKIPEVRESVLSLFNWVPTLSGASCRS
jgi:polysaccharide pyruvyl transferase WcaK-like protein